ncbi:16S rRNA (guanine(527)-N(7))-methyltransferase RsmG [Alicyclobacillus mali]|uniref:Ribosomal RNA small subunit methyltransferase G n=1 Tax=Alicyclobacillus mali (ex Roth et al. 2021) TaxID=1123961 RepID=A0ABS0F050_9BACL|nr:16S rRNA (guanine(527)-N(7))-methyltransferase RsmG [Alicyclobacillus mali (ex Roth et al. 2021)]MBF8376665.1 16S rRNA (guanine(527)-N(7))-methyltransferase RsmG [Alicyclobacillus mali (ex Roth et al. 2021)]
MRDVLDQMIAWGVPMSDETERRLRRYGELLAEWNERLNLTAIVETREMWIKHFLDSVAIAQVPAWRDVAKRGGRVIDIGSGAGIPGIPLAIGWRSVSFVLCDASRKRVQFVEHVIGDLGLSNVKALHARMEELGRQPGMRGSFDAAVARAVARSNVLLEYAAPMLRLGGRAFLYKGPSYLGEEEQDAVRAARLLGARPDGLTTYALMDDQGERVMAVFQQVEPCPKRFPRKPGTPSRQPL